MKTKLLYLITFILLISCIKSKDKEEINIDRGYLNTLSEKNKIKYLDNLYKNSKYNSKLFLDIANEYFELGKKNRYLNISKQVLKYSTELKDSLNMGRACYYISDYYETNQKDSCYFYLKKAEKIFLKTNNFDRLAKVHFNKAYLLYYSGIFTESELETTKALHYLSGSKNIRLLNQCLSLQGSNLEALGLYDEAITYFKQSSEIIPKIYDPDFNIEYFKSINFQDISNTYVAQKNYEESLKYLYEINLGFLKLNHKSFYASVLSNIAYSELKLHGPTHEVRTKFIESLYYAQQNDGDDKKKLMHKHKNIGEFYYATKEYNEATKYFKKALDLAKESQYNAEILNILKYLSETDKDNFFNYHSKYLDLNQELIQQQVKTKNKFARIEYETRKVEDQNKTLSKQVQFIIIVVLIILLIIVVFALTRINKSNKLALSSALQKNEAEQNLFDLLKQQQKLINKAQEKEKKRIAMELHDGIMNKLYSTRLNLGILNKKNDEQGIEDRKKLIKDLQNIEAEIRSLSHNLSKISLETNDYKDLLKTLINSQNSLNKTHFEININDERKLTELDTVYKFNLYRIVQECIQNIQKHAKAENAIINIDIFQDLVSILISDDGIGFDTENKKSGIGFNNIKYRVKSLKGKVKFKSSIGEGTNVQVTLPLNS